MNKIYVLVLSVSVFAMVACGGGEEKKKEDKKESEKEEQEEEEPAGEEKEVDYSYVIPQIDTNALTSEAEILAAMEKVIIARKTDDSLAENVSGYSGYYTELTNLYSTVMNKATQYSSTLKPKESLAFYEKFDAVTAKMYTK